MGQPKEKIQGANLMFAALVEFNSLQDAIDCYKSEEYQSALAELGEKPEKPKVVSDDDYDGDCDEVGRKKLNNTKKKKFLVLEIIILIFYILLFSAIFRKLLINL